MPRSSAEVESYFLRLRPELYAGPQAGPARDWLLAAWPGVRASERSTTPGAWRPPSASCPGWARRELGLSVAGPLDLLVDTAAVIPLTRAACPPGCAGSSRRPAERLRSPRAIEPAVDRHDLTGHVGGAGQGQDDLGHILAAGPTA